MMFPKFSPGMSLSPYGGGIGGPPGPFRPPSGQGQPLPFDPAGGGLQKPGMPGMGQPGVQPPGMFQGGGPWAQAAAQQQAMPAPMGMPQAQSQFGQMTQAQQLGAPQPRPTFNPPPFAELGLGGMSIGKGRAPQLDGIGGLGGAMRGFPGRAMY
jgi:hypothetical protein